MSAVTATPVRVPKPRPVGLPAPARRYLLTLVAVATVAAAAALANTPSVSQWSTLLLLLAGALVAHIFAVHTPKNQVFHTGLAFAVAGALLLPASLLVVLCLGQHAPDWIKHRYPWYIQTFNITNYLLSALFAYEVRSTLAGRDLRGSTAIAALALASLAFVLANHTLLATMLNLARDHSFKDTGLFSVDSLLTDAGLATLGAVTAILWSVTPAATALIFSPLLLMHRGFAIPTLKAQASRDPKTDLLNVRAFTHEAKDEIARAIRFERPLSLLMVDIDDLRGINNRHGHLAGDRALQALATAFAIELREYDIAARFGGDEFAVLLPETTAQEAHEIASRIRSRIKTVPLEMRPNAAGVTISAGIAELSHPESLETLLHRADATLYLGKAAGGDQVRSQADPSWPPA